MGHPFAEEYEDPYVQALFSFTRRLLTPVPSHHPCASIKL